MKLSLIVRAVLNRVGFRRKRGWHCRFVADAQLGVGQGLVGESFELEPGSVQGAELGRFPREDLGCQARVLWRDQADRQRLHVGGGTTVTATSRIEFRSSPAVTVNWNG